MNNKLECSICMNLFPYNKLFKHYNICKKIYNKYNNLDSILQNQKLFDKYDLINSLNNELNISIKLNISSMGSSFRS